MKKRQCANKKTPFIGVLPGHLLLQELNSPKNTQIIKIKKNNDNNCTLY